MADLSEQKIISTFDQLVAEGVIIYGPNEKIEIDCDGYPLEFRICPSLLRKPFLPGALLDSSFNRSRKFGPGSDLYLPHPSLLITTLNNTHSLALNLFCVDRPQYICVTVDSYMRQDEVLNVDDFYAALEMLNSLQDVYVIYNCSENGGCSRVHKHLQALKGKPGAFEVFTKPELESRIPFQYFSHHFTKGFGKTDGVEIVKVYDDMIERSRKVLGIGEMSVCSHNVILCRDWLIVVPRRKAAVGLASANAAGMLGAIWVPERKYVDEWLRLGCLEVLQALGVAR